MLIMLVFSAVMPLFWSFNFYFIYSERGWLFWLRHIFVLYHSCIYMKRETQWKKLVKGVLRQYNFTTATWLTAIVRPPDLRESKIGKMTTVSTHLPAILLRYRTVPILLWYFEQTSPSRLEVPSKDMQEAPTEDTVVILPWSCWLLFLLGPCSWHCYVAVSLACRLGCCHEPSTAVAAPAATASAASVTVTLAGCFPQHNQKGAPDGSGIMWRFLILTGSWSFSPWSSCAEGERNNRGREDRKGDQKGLLPSLPVAEYTECL